jgi:hypothetical protein
VVIFTASPSRCRQCSIPFSRCRSATTSLPIPEIPSSVLARGYWKRKWRHCESTLQYAACRDNIKTTMRCVQPQANAVRARYTGGKFLIGVFSN